MPIKPGVHYERWHIVLALIPIVVLLAWWHWTTYKRDPSWELRWQELPPEERKRLAEAARLGVEFEDPEEAWLVAGSKHMQEHFWFDAPWKRLLATAVAMASVYVLIAVVRVFG